MKYKVHWIIDGIMEIEASTLPLISIVEALDILPLNIAPFPIID